jgi:2-methylcitrate dehydratase PrpD
MAVTRTLATWIAESGPLATGAALGLARNAMIDIIGCMIAGAADESTGCAFDAVRDLGDGPASVLGAVEPLSAPLAALVNGTAAHALDFDDNYHGTCGHATAVLAPALLALAEERGLGGAAVLDAYIAGLEALLVIGAGVNVAHYEKGWHTTSTIGVIGAAGAAARLMGLDADGVQRALSLGFSHASGSKLQFGTMAKPLHAGMAAKNALMAARYAQAGLSAADEPLEPAWGFRDLYIGFDTSPGYDDASDLLGPPLAIERYGLKVKIHPDCASTHCAVDGVLALMAEHGLGAGDIDSVETVVNKVSYDNLMFPEPASEMQARFSMQYGIALAVTKGALKLADFRPEAIADEAVRAWLPRVKMSLSPPHNPLATADNGREPAKVFIRTKDGRKFEIFVQHAKGVLQNPLTEDEMWAKFDDCVEGVMDPAKAAGVRSRLESFEALDEVGDLMCLLRAPS